MNIAVLGAGAWGTALAISAAQSGAGARRVTLWARDAAQIAQMRHLRENARYLPGIPLPRELHLRGGAPDEGLQEAVPQADLIIIATPVAGLRPGLAAVRTWPGS